MTEFNLAKRKKSREFNILLLDVINNVQKYRDLAVTDNMLGSINMFRNRECVLTAAQYATYKQIGVHNASVHLNVMFNKGFLERKKKLTTDGFVYVYRIRESLRKKK